MTDAIYDVWPIPGTHPVPYEPRLGRAKVEAEFARVTRLFTEASTEDFRREYADDIAAFARGLSDPRNAEVYLKDRPLIARMIGAEFDTETPGTRRIGMTSNVVPRLGGLFRDEIAEPDTQSTLGPLIEQVMLAGFAAAIGTYQTAKKGVPELRDRPIEEVWRQWVSQVYAGLRGMERFRGATEQPLTVFVDSAEQLDPVGRFGRRRKLRILAAHFFANSGAALYEVNTDLVDGYA